MNISTAVIQSELIHSDVNVNDLVQKQDITFKFNV